MKRLSLSWKSWPKLSPGHVDHQTWCWWFQCQCRLSRPPVRMLIGLARLRRGLLKVGFVIEISFISFFIVIFKSSNFMWSSTSLWWSSSSSCWSSKANGARWMLAIVERWSWSWPTSWIGDYQLSRSWSIKVSCQKSKTCDHKYWMIIHDEHNQFPGTRKSWPPSNRSTQEQSTPLPSKLISGCPLQPGDTLLDGEDHHHNEERKW